MSGLYVIPKVEEECLFILLYITGPWHYFNTKPIVNGCAGTSPCI